MSDTKYGYNATNEEMNSANTKCIEELKGVGSHLTLLRQTVDTLEFSMMVLKASSSDIAYSLPNLTHVRDAIAKVFAEVYDERDKLLGLINGRDE